MSSYTPGGGWVVGGSLDTIHLPKMHSRHLPNTIRKYIQSINLYPGWWGGGWLQVIIMPLRGPTCKIARFQAELKIPSWTECGNNHIFQTP